MSQGNRLSLLRFWERQAWVYYVSVQRKLEFIMCFYMNFNVFYDLGSHGNRLSLLGFWERQAWVYYVSVQCKLEFTSCFNWMFYVLGLMETTWVYYVSGKGKLEFIRFLGKASFSLLVFSNWISKFLWFRVLEKPLESIRFLGKASLSLLGFWARQAWVD